MWNLANNPLFAIDSHSKPDFNSNFKAIQLLSN
jgi:hypothetical protein